LKEIESTTQAAVLEANSFSADGKEALGSSTSVVHGAKFSVALYK
jgi:hypothetical protein